MSLLLVRSSKVSRSSEPLAVKETSTLPLDVTLANSIDILRAVSVSMSAVNFC